MTLSKRYSLGILLVLGIVALVYIFKHKDIWCKYQNYQITSEFRKDVTLIRDSLLCYKFEGFISVAGDSLYFRRKEVSGLPTDFIKSKMDRNEVKGLFVGSDFIFVLLDGGDFFSKSYGLLCTKRLNPDFSFIRKSRLLFRDSKFNEMWFFVEANL